MKTANPELQPLSEMPIWARLQFAEMVPVTYSYDCNEVPRPRASNEAVVLGFARKGNTVHIFFELFWSDVNAWSTYIWPAVKSGNRQDAEY